MSKTAYHPARGDIIHINFSPSSGKEFGLPHFGLVISSLAFSKHTGLCIVLPMTTKFHIDQRLQNLPLMVKMPPIEGLKEEGWIHTHQIKTIDYRERGAALKTRLGDDHLDFLIDVMDRVRAFIDPDTVA